MSDREVRFKPGRIVVGGTSPSVVVVPPVGREHGPGQGHGKGIPASVLTAVLIATGGKVPGGAIKPAAFIPVTPVLDFFDRADENPLSGGGNWLAFFTATTSPLQLLSHAVTGTSTTRASQSYWTPATFGPNTETYVTVAALPASTSNYIRLRVRLNIGSAQSYMMQWSNDANGCRIFREAGQETFTQLAQALSTYGVGDQITMRAVGSTISIYKNGFQVLATSDSTYSAAGNIGVGCRDTTVRLDAFGGGTL